MVKASAKRKDKQKEKDDEFLCDSAGSVRLEAHSDKKEQMINDEPCGEARGFNLSVSNDWVRSLKMWLIHEGKYVV